MHSRVADYGFFAALLVAAFLFYRTIHAVIVPVVLGAFLAVLVRPICERVSRRLGNRARLGATLTTILVMFIVVVPMTALAWAIVQQVYGSATSLAGSFSNDGVVGAIDDVGPLKKARRALRLTEADLKPLVERVVSYSGNLIKEVVQLGSALLVGVFLLVISLYYFLLDGKRWMKDVERMAPIEPRYVRAFAREFASVSHALVYGSAMTALVQGVAAFVGYWLFGVPVPLLWAAATAVMSLTPIIGTASIWAPIAVFMFATGEPGRGVGIAVWGTLVIGSMDNVLRPLFMNGRMQLHPLVVFLSIIGGVAAFGMEGIFFGPLAAALFLTALRIYDRDYRARLLEPEDPPVVMP